MKPNEVPKPVERKVEVAIISDVHLGTYGCHAKELLAYLKSIRPITLILNGDIIYVWQFSKRYLPKSCMKMVKELMSIISKGTKVYYIHQPEMRTITTEKGSILYLNSGDWIENLTALEYNAGEWTLYKHSDAEVPIEDNDDDPDASQLFNSMFEEFNLLKTK